VPALESLDTPEPKQSNFAGFRLKNKTSTYFTKDRMTLDQAVDIMEQYAVNLELDDLSAIEHMVRRFKILPLDQRLALETFMDATRDPAHA
jgi:hypothetical protein